MFVKYSEGQIASVINNEEGLSERQKKAFQETSVLADNSSKDEHSAEDAKKQGS
jgi:hypothetical protein